MALWREALLAQAVLAGRTRGYRSHPQLERFAAAADPCAAIRGYLEAVRAEAAGRGYSFDASRIDRGARAVSRIAVSRGQVEYEWALFGSKVAARAPERCDAMRDIEFPSLHPCFRLVEGGIADWERPKDLGQEEPQRRRDAE